jgi:glycosyltransferase involved in cell wall biosynthesis
MSVQHYLGDQGSAEEGTAQTTWARMIQSVVTPAALAATHCEPAGRIPFASGTWVPSVSRAIDGRPARWNWIAMRNRGHVDRGRAAVALAEARVARGDRVARAVERRAGHRRVSCILCNLKTTPPHVARCKRCPHLDDWRLGFVENRRRLNIVAMLSVYDEADIIAAVIENLLAQDVSLVILDNGSNDGSYEICERFAGNPEVALARWNPQGVDIEHLSLKLFELASRRQPDWLLFSDGDEILETASAGRTLRQDVEQADAANVRVLQCDRFDFFWTDADDAGTASPVERLQHYSWQGDFNFRVFRNVPGIRAAPSFAHYPLFPPGYRYAIAPEKLVLRHYPYRSLEHGSRKIGNLIGKFDAHPVANETWQKRYRRIQAQGLHLRPTDHRLLVRRRAGEPWNRNRMHGPFVDQQPRADDLFDADGLLRARPGPQLDWSRASGALDA